MSSQFKGKTIVITGASRGIGREIALALASSGANIAVLAKTDTPHPKLPGTIHTVAEEIEKFGGKALPIKLDVRDDQAVEKAMQAVASHFGGIDVLVNNASAIQLTDTMHTEMKRFDLMMGVNMRATFACSRACIPYLSKSDNPHILNLSPPLNMNAKWFAQHVAYTMSKYGMSMCTLGMAEEFKKSGIAVNSLWPKTAIHTAAIQHNFPPEVLAGTRDPKIMADAAVAILSKEAKSVTGNFFVDEDFLRDEGVQDFSVYQENPDAKLFPDFFLD